MPVDIQIVDNLPLTANGKIDRAQLRSWERAVPESAGVPTAGSDDLVSRLGVLWQAVLNRAGSERLAFFAAGGDSLMAAELSGRIIEQIPEAEGIFFDDLLRRVLEGPTVAALAQLIVSSGGSATAPIAVTEPSLVFAGAADRPCCVFAHDGEVPTALQDALTSQFRLAVVTLNGTDPGIPALAAAAATRSRSRTSPRSTWSAPVVETSSPWSWAASCSTATIGLSSRGHRPWRRRPRCRW